MEAGHSSQTAYSVAPDFGTVRTALTWQIDLRRGNTGEGYDRTPVATLLLTGAAERAEKSRVFGPLPPLRANSARDPAL